MYIKLLDTDYDLIDCMRREVKTLSEKWMDLCQHTENKERILEDIYLVIIQFLIKEKAF